MEEKIIMRENILSTNAARRAPRGVAFFSWMAGDGFLSGMAGDVYLSEMVVFVIFEQF